MKPTLETCITKTTITFKDITGRYDATNNLDGWGTPNIDYMDIVECTVKVTNISTGNNVTYILPIEQTIGTPEEVSFSPFTYAYEDGIIEVEYFLKDSSNIEYTHCRRSFFMLNIDCCLDTILSNAVFNDEDTIYMNKVMKAEAIRAALCKAALCMNTERINYFFNKLKLICNPCATVT